MRAATELPQWQPPSDGAQSRAAALQQQQHGAAPYYSGGSPAVEPMAPPRSALRRVWNGFWALFFFSLVCAILALSVNTNIKVRGLGGGGACVDASAVASGAPLGLPPPLATATWAAVLAKAKARALRPLHVARMRMHALRLLTGADGTPGRLRRAPRSHSRHGATRTPRRR
jgi:hypothetical protein